MKKFLAHLFILSNFVLPVAVFAATTTTNQTTGVNTVCVQSTAFTTVADIVNMGTCLLIRSVIPLLFALATVAFLWGVITYFLNPDNEEKRNQGKSYITWGLIALAVMASMWGLVQVLSNTFGIRTMAIPQLSQ